jgi:hypothetical protein
LNSNNEELDTSLRFILKNIPAFADFFGPSIFGKEFRVRHYQLEPMLSKDILVEGGRGGGKSLSMEFIILNTAINDIERENSIVVGFRKVYVRDRMEDIISMFHCDPLLSEFLKKVRGREPINRQPRYEVHAYRRGTVYGVAVGEDKNAASLQGLHPRWRFMEESQYFPRYAWDKFIGTAAERGTVDRNFGIRNGVRGTPWWDWDTKKKEYTRFCGSRFGYTRRWNPYYNEEMFLSDVASFGSEDSPEFTNQVDGEWGTPREGIWNLRHVYDCVEAGRTLDVLTVESRDIEQGRAYDLMISNWIARHPDATRVRLGVDVQYTEPTCALVLQFYEDKWHLTSCLWLADQMSHSLQATCIEQLAMALGGVSDIALDITGGDGRAVFDSLRESGSPMVAKLTPIDWKSTVLVEQRRESDDLYAARPEPLKVTNKDNSVRVLREMLANKTIGLPDSEKVIGDLMSETQKRVARGWTVDAPRNVHIPEALRTFCHSLYLTQDEEFFGSAQIGPYVDMGTGHSGAFGRKEVKESGLLRRLFG